MSLNLSHKNSKAPSRIFQANYFFFFNNLTCHHHLSPSPLSSPLPFPFFLFLFSSLPVFTISFLSYFQAFSYPALLFIRFLENRFLTFYVFISCCSQRQNRTELKLKSVQVSWDWNRISSSCSGKFVIDLVLCFTVKFLFIVL